MLDDLSIVIVTWNGDPLLSRCLDSLSRVCGNRPQVIVVDNAGLETTRALSARYENVQYVRAEGNLGFAGGNNLGLRFCTRKYVLLLNNDTVVRAEPFTQLMEYLEKHPRVAVVQGKMVLPHRGNVLDTCGFLLTSLGAPYERLGWRSAQTCETPTATVYAAKGALMLIRRDVISAVGGLFYDHFFSFHEEIDFCHRVWLGGWEVAFVDTPAVDHYCGSSASRLRRTDVAARNIANRLFSYLTTFGGYGLSTVFAKHCCCHVALFVRALLCFRKEGVATYVNVVRNLWGRRGLILPTRRKVQAMRKVSDRELFKRIMVRPPWSWYWAALP